ncbi:MalM family protein [Photobacterium rosenbergii]|uniref:MalM family protein n=1 Tax=Photobacterium rosenbergii TaxID=294936 RepID=A0ABU3ZJL2_9GAMM|nr:MalM family protein [Photobacterium rosenbergii]MDV5170299.1 MalM family protein [Photobacterium rosenbergii]
MIKSITIILSLCFVMTSGCSSIPEVSTQAKSSASNRVVSSAELNWQELAMPLDINFEFNEKSQVLVSDESTGPVASFVIPVTSTPIEMVLTSYVDSKLTLYNPNVLITDPEGEVLYHIESGEFKYIPARLLQGDQVQARFTIAPKFGTEQVNVLIYTTPEDLEGSTTVLHPAKAFAIGKGNQPPSIPDLKALHSRYGQLHLTALALGQGHQGTAYYAPDYRPASNTSTSLSGQIDYLDSIQNSVEQGDMDQAITLLNEAEEKGVPNARETFINAVESQKGVN